MSTETIKDSEYSLAQAKAQFESIKEMVEAVEAIDYNENEIEYEEAQQTIQEDALDINIRSGWHVPGEKQTDGQEYTILLCTGGPAVRIIGDLNEYQEPETARIEHQDWGTPWTDYPLSSEEEETKCYHPPIRSFSGNARIVRGKELIDIIWVGCLDCGKISEFLSPFKKR